MPSTQESFKSVVIEPFKVNMGAQTLSYSEYFELPPHLRSNDEAAVVDIQFTQKMLEWLGYKTGDIVYNRTQSGHPQDKPDFVVKSLGSTAFIVEDKSTDESFDDASVKQLRRYTAGTVGYCLWINARSVLGLRFDSSGQYQTLVEVRIDGTFGAQQSLFPQEANFEILRLLFQKQRFTDASGLIKSVAITEEEWKQQARSLADEQSLKEFITESRYVLDQLMTAVKARLSTVALELEEAADDLTSSKQKYLSIVSNLIINLRNGVSIEDLSHLNAKLQKFEPVLVDVDIARIERLKPLMRGISPSIWTNGVREIGGLLSTLRERELARTESRRIRAAYLVWRERYKVIEEVEEEKNELDNEVRRQQAFAEQVSYVFFVRLLLARVLEDKGLMHRLVSDGGFSAWYDFLKLYAPDSTDEIRGEAFLPLVYRRVASFYRHFFQQPVFDWFLPDDYLVALVLQRLNSYNFKDVTSDLLGFTYEAFIDRVARNKKGHFLTPPSVVEFMLDRMAYNTSSIIGVSLLDPACGSGSFLVHGARRLKQVLASTMATKDQTEFARAFIDQVKTRFVGLEINPFSCYLAELNLFIQVLDELTLLWQRGEHLTIERFAIYNTNSLEMPKTVLFSGPKSTSATLIDDIALLDEATLIKHQQGNFGFVVCNPPYINRGIILDAKSYGDFPFYSDIVKGDENFYLLFLRLASYYVVPGGSVCFICPLNLFGDESTMHARDIFGGAEWNVKSLTRFYSRTVLFPGVLQGVCVVHVEKAPDQPAHAVEVRGGFTVEEAAREETIVQSSRITHNYPSKGTWNRPWLVNTNLDTYALWEFVRDKSNQDLENLLKSKMKVHEGDARSTWAKPMLVSGPGLKHVPLTKGDRIVDWGNWTAVSYLDPSVTIPASTKDRTSCLWVQKQVQRVASLTHSETAIFLKEVSGLEMKRPIRGTIIRRDGQHPVVADHTVLVMHTLDAMFENLAYAVFGLLTSSIYNFFFSLFSTNAHANFKEIQRLPIPLWSPALEKQLAEKTKTVLFAYKELYDHQIRYGLDKGLEHVSINTVLTSTRLPTLRLEELIMRGDIQMNGSVSHTLENLLKNSRFLFSQSLSSDAVHAIEDVLRANGTLAYAKGGKDIPIPLPHIASQFLSQLHGIESERIGKLQAAKLTQHGLDEMVIDAYNIVSPSWREIIESGVPWAKN